MAAIVKGIYVDNARVVDDEEKQRILANQASGGSSSSSSSSGSSKPKEEQEIEKPEVKQEEDLFSPEKKEQPEIQQEPEKKQPTVIFSTEDQQRQLAQIRSQRWYSGDTPTEVEILAQITRIAEVDYAEGQSLADLYLKQKSEGMYAQTYASATSQYMKDLGLDPSQMTPEAIAEFQSFIDQYGVNTASGGVSTAKRNGKNAKLASDLSNLLKDHFDTQEILKEQDEALREASYWIAQGLTDDEIIKKLGIGSGGKYTKLNKLFEKGEVGEIVPTTAAIALGTDYGLQGALYMMRNPDGSSGDVLFDAVNALLGRGAKNPSTPQDIARRTPGDPAWAPYATSGTMHDEAILFGVTGFDRKWLDDNYARIAASGDPKLQEAYKRVAKAMDITDQAKQEAAAFRKYVDSKIAMGESPDLIFTDEMLDGFPTLKAMYEGQKTLDLVDTTSPVDFDLYALRNEAEKAYKDVEGTVPGKDYAQRLETNLGVSTPSYEGDSELDKAEEENLTLVQEIMYFTSTPHEQDAAKSSKPNYYRVMASAASGVSAGTGGTKEAYNSAITAANDYAGAHYLTAVGALAEAQQHLNDLKDAAKPMDDFLEKWFPEQDKGKVAEGLVNGDIATPDDPEFQKEYGEMKRHLGDYQTYLTNLTEAEGAVANEQRVIDNIAAQYAAAEELNTTGAPSQSAMPMLNYISAYTNYNPAEDFAAFGDWQYDVEINNVPWSEVSEQLGKRKENNAKSIEELDAAIEYAQSHGADEQTVTNMRRTKDILELDNKLIDYAKMQDSEGFAEAVKRFDDEESLAFFSFSEEDRIKNAIIGYEDAVESGMSEERYLASPNVDKTLTPKIAMLTESERNTYKYLYASPEYGPEAATEFFNLLDGSHLNNRTAEFRKMQAEKATEQNPVLMNALSIMASPYQALGVVEVVSSVFAGDEIDPNSEWFAMAQVVGEVRDTSTEMIVEHFGEGTTAAKVATFAYQTGTSIGDSLAAAPLGGAVTMGLESFANTAMEATLNGGDKWDVILLAGITGLAEVGTEYIPMKGLEDAFKAGGKTGLKNHLADLMKSAASGLTEAPGEALSELISGAADTIIMDELSAYSQNVAQYMQSGMTEEEANRKATQDFWKNVGMAGLQGLASGGVQNTVAYVAGSALKGKPQQARPVMEEQTAAPVVEEAPAPTEETAVAQEEAPEPGGGLLAEAMADQNAAPEITPEPEKAKNTRMVAALATAQQDGISLSDRTATVNGVLEAGGLEPGLALAYAKEIAKDIPGLQQLQQSIQKMTTGDTATALKAAAYRMFAPPANADTMSDADVVSAVESDPKLSGAVENAVLNSDIATETMNVLKAMDKKAVENATTSQQNAKRAMNGAATEMGTKNAAAGAAFRALQSANEALKQNPADPKAATKAVEAAKQHQLKKAEAEEARRRYEASKQTFLDANKALQKEKQKAHNEARRAAKETVMQRRAEQMAAAQQQKEAEAQRVAEQNAAMEQKAAEETEQKRRSVDEIKKELSEAEEKEKAFQKNLEDYVNNYTGESIFSDSTYNEMVSNPEWQSARDRTRELHRELLVAQAKDGNEEAIESLTDEERSAIRPDLEGVWKEYQKYDKIRRDLAYKKDVKGIFLGQNEYRMLEDAKRRASKLRESYFAAWRNNSNGEPKNEASPLNAPSAPTLTMNPQTQQPTAPVSDIPAPPDGMGVSQFAGQTGQNTNVISDGVKQELHDSPYYKKTTQRENVDRAISVIEKDGYEVRKNKILDGTTDIMTPEGQAELYVLTKVAKDTGDAAGESAIVFKAKESGTTLAQAMAMRKLYIDMSPAGKTQYVERIIDQMNRELEGRGSDRRIVPPEWLAKRLEEANGDDQQTNAVLDDAYRYIAEQTPPSIGDRINTWRYLAMLGNPLTHAKNFLSTLAQTPYVLVKNKMAAVGEIIAQNAAKKKGKDFERTKSLGPIKKEYLDVAKEVYQEYKSTLRGDPETPMQKINDWRSKSWAWMDKLSRYNSKKMSDEDMFFKKRYFQNALASYLQANKIDVANPNPEVMARATQYAYEQAMKNTFNNTNAFAEWLTSAQNDAKRRGGLVKLADPIIGAILPFKKTPANVVMRGIEYSPLGLLNSITTNSIKLKRGKDFNGKPYTINQWIDSVSAGLTGTMAAGLGGLLAAIGVLELGDEEEDKLRGVQKNSINVLGFNISIDSFGSAAMPLLIGAEMYEQFMADQPEYLEDGFQLTDTPELFTQFLSALGTVADPVMELSVMQGLNSLLSSASYSDNSLFAIGERVGTSFVSQFVPSFAGAIARLADSTRRTVYIDKNSALDSQMQYFLQSIRNKIPGLSQQGAAYLDVWGNEVSNGDFVTRLLSNFLIPGSPKKQQDPDEVTQRLLQLFDDTGMEGFLPSEANKYFTVDGERYNLSAEEYQKYSKIRGDIAHEALESLMANEEFNTAGDVPMVTAVNRVWSYASQMAAYSVNDGYKVESGVLNADNPVEYALEGMRDKAKAEQQAEYELGLVDAIAAGDIQSATACVAGLKQTGRKNNTIKNKVANAYRMKYKTMYEEGDIDGMADLERDLYSLGIGFSVSDFEKWLK